SETFMSFLMRYKKKDFNLSLEGDRLKYIELVIKDLALINSQIEKEYYLEELSEEFDISMNTLEDELARHHQTFKQNKDKEKKDRYTNNSTTFYRINKLRPAFHNAERKLIAYMLKNRAITDKVREEIGASFNIDEHKVIATHLRSEERRVGKKWKYQS